jgi:hypothetical protein
MPYRFRPFKQHQRFPENLSAALQQLHETFPEDSVARLFPGSAPHVRQEPLHVLLYLSSLLLKRLSLGCHRASDIGHA